MPKSKSLGRLMKLCQRINQQIYRLAETEPPTLETVEQSSPLGELINRGMVNTETAERIWDIFKLVPHYMIGQPLPQDNLEDALAAAYAIEAQLMALEPRKIRLVYSSPRGARKKSIQTKAASPPLRRT